MKFRPHKEIKRIWRLFKLQRDLDWEDQMFDITEIQLNGAKADSAKAKYTLERLGEISRRIISIERAIYKIQNL